MLDVGVEFGLALQRVEIGIFHCHRLHITLKRLRCGTTCPGSHRMVDRFGIGRRGGCRAALGREHRPGIVGQLDFLGRFCLGQFLSLDLLPLRLELFLAAFGRGARDERGQKATQPAALLGNRLILRLERLVDFVARRGFAIGRHAEMRRNLGPDDFRVGQATGAEFTASHWPGIGIDHPHACLLQPADIALGRLVLPHAHIHCGHDHYRLVGRKDQRGCEVIRDACCHLGHQIRRCRAHHHQIRLAAELDMAHLGLVLEIPQRGVDRVLTQRGERHGGDKLLSAFCHDAGNIAAALADQPHQLARFVGRDAAAHYQQYARGACTAHAQRPWFTGVVRPEADIVGIPLFTMAPA